MARGLSDLQRAILLLAYRKRCERLAKMEALEEGSHEWAVLDHGIWATDLYFPEVLHERYGFPVSSIWWKVERGERPRWGNNFSMRDIGEQRYRKAQASLSRAVRRLEAKGLVERFHPVDFMQSPAHLDLTDEGVRVAEQLSVNTMTSVTAEDEVEYPYVWTWGKSESAPALNPRKGQRCRVLVRSRTMNSALIEFEDGFRANTSRNGIRRAGK